MAPRSPADRLTGIIDRGEGREGGSFHAEILRGGEVGVVAEQGHRSIRCPGG